jgi:hypothetical protein
MCKRGSPVLPIASMSILKENGSSFIQMDRKYSTITAHWINLARNAKD